jgi:hypothetical protein
MKLPYQTKQGDNPDRALVPTNTTLPADAFMTADDPRVANWTLLKPPVAVAVAVGGGKKAASVAPAKLAGAAAAPHQPSTVDDSLEKINELGDLIKMEYLDTYDDWLKIVWSLATVGAYDVALRLSQKSNKFEQKAFDKVYHCNTAGAKRVSMRTFHHYCRESNKDRCNEIMEDAPMENSEASFAETFLKLEGHNIIYNTSTDDMFIWNGTNWTPRPSDAMCSKRPFESRSPSTFPAALWR